MKNAPIFIILLGVFAHLNPLAQTSQSSAGDDWISEGLKPQWIWRADKTNNEPIYLRKTFDTPKNIQSAKLYATCDNGADVYLNGKKIGTASVKRFNELNLSGKKVQTLLNLFGETV